MNVIALGNEACTLAATFGTYPQYDIFYCKEGYNQSDGLSLPSIKKVEDAEHAEVNFEALKQIDKEPVIFVLNGAEETSAYALRILEQIKDRSINILYIKPNLNLLNTYKKKIERMVFGVLQEYARSGLFEKIYLVDYKQVETIIGDVPVLEHSKIISKTIVDAVHLLNYLHHADKIIDKLLSPNPINRICTIGLFNIETGEEEKFFDLQEIREKQIFYLLTNHDLTTNKNLMSLINQHTDRLKMESETVSFAVAESYHENSYACTVSYTNLVQGMEKWLTEP